MIPCLDDLISGLFGTRREAVMCPERRPCDGGTILFSWITLVGCRLYGPIGLVRESRADRRFDEQVSHRHGPGFERARSALATWQHFDIGWVEPFPRQASIDPGTIVAVLIRHLGFWSLNGARVLYRVDGAGGRRAAFGFGYGTLTNHAESGEELFRGFLRSSGG